MASSSACVHVVSVCTHAQQHIRRAQCWALAHACPALCSLGKVPLTAERLHHALTCTRTTTYLCSSNVCVLMGSVLTVTQQQHQLSVPLIPAPGLCTPAKCNLSNPSGDSREPALCMLCVPQTSSVACCCLCAAACRTLFVSKLKAQLRVL